MTIAAKATGNCIIQFEPKLDQSYPNGVAAAKLFISCPQKPELVPWVYYLKGVISAPGTSRANK